MNSNKQRESFTFLRILDNLLLKVCKKVVDLKIKEYYKYIPIVKDIFIF
jgi:hypothetical protein